MDPVYYYRLLGLRTSATEQEVKKAYRAKVRLCHPDLNKNPGAADKFIEITEAYEFILDRIERLKKQDLASEYYEEWKRKRQSVVRARARKYASVRYREFKNSELYRTSMILDITGLIITLLISALILFGAIFGYIVRLQMVNEGFEKPSLLGFIFLLSIGLIFSSITLIYIIVYYKAKSNRKK